MFNLNEIIQAAQGGAGITTLAQQFGLSPEQVQAAVKSMVPGLWMYFNAFSFAKEETNAPCVIHSG